MQCVCAMYSSVVCPNLHIFLYYLIYCVIAEKKLLNIKCVLIFSTSVSEKFIILIRTERDTIKNIYWSPHKVLVILVRF
jgi:hypothetical protein